MRLRQNPGDPLGMLKGSSGHQPLKTFVARNVEPQATSTIQLSGGKNKPYHYSLATASTVPFASVEGSGGIQKQFSWGETIEVPPGITVNVRNASHHAGDIVIQSGEDRSNTPARITFPIEFEEDPISEGGISGTILYRTTGYIDTRRAVRGYWAFRPKMFEDSRLTTVIVGYYSQHTANEGNAGFANGAWQSDCAWPVLTELTYIPIGFAANQLQLDVDLPMAFPDYVRIFAQLESFTAVPPYTFDTMPRPNFITLEY